MDSPRGRGRVGYRGRGGNRGNRGNRGRGGFRGRGGGGKPQDNERPQSSSDDFDTDGSDSDDLNVFDRVPKHDDIKVELPKQKSNIFNQSSSNVRSEYKRMPPRSQSHGPRNFNKDQNNNNNNRSSNSYNNRQPKRDYNNAKIESNRDVFRELRDKLKPNLKNVDEKIYVQLDKFNKIIDMIASEEMKDQTVDAFLELCKVFTLPDLKACKDPNKQSSIYSIFFNNNQFKLSPAIKKMAIPILMGVSTEDQIKLIFDFFKVLIDVSSSNFEILQSDFQVLQRLSEIQPVIKKYVDDIKKYSDVKAENEAYSFESAVSPTAEDLFINKKSKIDNSINKEWRNFNEYKRAMIDLTKENFYTPFRSALDQLKKKTLDYRDLFLYEDVYIPFTDNIDNYKVFKECNFFLSFRIRTPPNCKKQLSIPNWKQTDQLGNRSLLILSTSPDLLRIDAVCRSCAAARSLDVDQSKATINFLNSGLVPVVLISGQIKENVKYYMFEPTSCWPAVQPVLQRLLKMNEVTFPSYFLRKIIKLDFSDNSMPETNKIKTDILMLDRPAVRDRHPYEKMASENWAFDRYSPIQMSNLLRVDHEQYRALRYALTHNLTLVNGAPGTGKTHFAREYLRVMNELAHPKPIVVVTYTNHALDSILEGVLPFIDSEKLIRWGGPMRSTNKTLKERVWKNYYLSKEVRLEKNEIVTKKQNLKNMYNLRQMATQCIGALQKNPMEIRVYKKIMKVLNYFFKANEKMANHYPIDLTPEETKEYLNYLNSRDERIRYLSLPSQGDAIDCWVNGEDFYHRRNQEIRNIYNYNKGIVVGQVYHNPYENLKSNNLDDPDDYYYDKEEEEDKKDKDESNIKPDIHPSPDDFAINSSKVEMLQQKEADKKVIEEYDDNVEEEEEELFEDKIYNDEDVTEMTRVSLDGTEIEENLPKAYIKEVLEGKFAILFSNTGKKPHELMIDYLKIISDPLTRMINAFEEDLQKQEIAFNERETREAGRFLQKMKLIGMTSTVASVRKEALEVAGCEILIVEEAGELTESMLSCILPSSLKRMILIGDYQQLRPKVEHELTFDPCNYDVSLFEKLVVNAKKQRAECLFTLSVQRRMHPQISALIRNVFYNEGKEQINDAESTNNLGIPFGIPYRVRFYMHNFEESKISSRSHANPQEAKFCASLVPFFICRGYKPEDITIISLYKGQMFLIQREIDKLYDQCRKSSSSKMYDPFGSIRSPRQIKVVVLDNFQGEENKVIIVSLTRSDRPGFVKNRNRALVTLSRAREMLVVLGNERVFGKENKIKENEQWRKISDAASHLSPFAMSKPDCEGLVVNKCIIHKPNSANIPSFLKTPDQILRFRFSYCKEKCNFKLPCGHNCQLVCHCHSFPPGPTEHDDYYCPFQCEKHCVNGHRCKGNCGKCTHNKTCPPCKEKIHHKFPCGHEADIECYLVTSGKAKCRTECGKPVKRCGHPCKLQCGHKGDCDCKVQLDKECENCGRTFKYKCGEDHPKCMRECNHVLPCGHVCSGKCFECIERRHHETECQRQCEFIFPCGHRCPCKCCDKFPAHQHFICRTEVTLIHNFCGNHNTPLKQECSRPIQCNFPCQHFCNVCKKQCPRKCSEHCIDRCNCRCQFKCAICGKRCRALSGEKCAIFCEHSTYFKDVLEPPESEGILYVFHGNHFLPLKDAREKVLAEYESIIHGQGDLPVPVSRLMCPIEGCRCKEPCIVGSWLFDHYNKEIENVLKQIRAKSENYIAVNKNSPNESQFDKVHWYFCESCGELFFIKFDNVENIIVKCPNCGMQKGEMFE
ncbi:hypothetical protein M9Y10_042759 [Tritrichomonas musculus]|uniref:NFX1-type zinc finger-containing protein 1 n=1 Tax=Tritrichomonas musculus TaxID=1915356 RepID=A0ABR2JY80_9EUKA